MNPIDHLIDIVRKNEGREFLIDSISEKTLTFGDFHVLALNVAGNLKERGVKKGDRIAIILENSISTAALYFGCLYLGAVAVPINIAFSKDDIDFIIQNSGASLLIFSETTREKIDSDHFKKSKCALLECEPYRDKRSSPATWCVFDLPEARNIKAFEDVHPQDILTIIYTSGTTDKPKGVVHRIESLTNNAKLFCEELQIGEKNRFFGILSMTYLGGYYNLLFLPFVAGSSVVITRTFDAPSALEFWQVAERHHVNTLWLVPSIIAILMKIDRGKTGEDFCRRHIIKALVGTAPLPLKLKKGFEERYGITLYENYGLSETLFISTNGPGTVQIDQCVGRLLPSVQLRILDDQGQPRPFSEEGEIHVQTPFQMSGYYNAASQTPDMSRQDRWFATGDMGILTDQGDLFITGRKKDLIIRGGVNVSPAAVEHILNGHPRVETGIVVGVPHEIYGEDIVAVVRLRKGYVLDDVRDELKQYCNQRLGHARKIGHILEIEEFPLGSTGKILKNQVKEMVIKKLNLSSSQKTALPAGGSSSKKSSSIIPGCIRSSIQRADAKLVKELGKFDTSIISDCLNRLCTMNSTIKPLVPGRTLCGSAVTVEEVEGGNLMSHAALELLYPGDVLVIDAKGTNTRSCWGGLQTLMAKRKGAAGIVIFGCVRDYDEIVRSQLPVFALGCNPAGPLKGWTGNVNCPVSCGGVVVNPGDIIVGDNDGVVVVPPSQAGRLIEICQKRSEMEKKWLERVQKGEATIDVVGLRDKIDGLERR